MASDASASAYWQSCYLGYGLGSVFSQVFLLKLNELLQKLGEILVRRRIAVAELFMMLNEPLANGVELLNGGRQADQIGGGR